jgi:hypothetical protein
MEARVPLSGVTKRYGSGLAALSVGAAAIHFAVVF